MMKKLISDVKIGDIIAWYNTNYSRYYKGEVIKIEVTKSAKSYKVLLKDAYVKKHKSSDLDDLKYKYLGQGIEIIVRATVNVEVE